MAALHFSRFMALAGLVIPLLMACSGNQTASSPTATPSPVIAARDQLQANLRQCTTTTGYDPQHVTGVAENALAPHELQWRQCAYDAVHAYIQANPPMTVSYNNLVAQDIAMTTAIQQGTMTRTQRRARIEALLQQIHEAENQQIQAETAAQSEQLQQVRSVVQDMRGFAR